MFLSYMAEHRYPRSVQTKLRFKVALVCAAIGLALMFIAVRFQAAEFLMSSPGEHRAGRAYSRIWFTDFDTLVGASQQGSRITIERWATSGSTARTWQFDFSASDAQWAVAPDLSRI